MLLVSITLQLDLPENLLKRAEREGLLRPENIKAIIEAELARLDRRRRIESLRDLPGDAMSGAEIESEIAEIGMTEPNRPILDYKTPEKGERVIAGMIV